MAEQIFKELNIEKEDLEWLYAPDMKYFEYEDCERYLQLIIPYKRNWDEDKKFPLVMFIPGSAWHKQEMYNNIPKRATLAKRGFAIAEVQYRESEIATFPAQVIDVKNAIKFMYSIAEQFHIDMDNVFVAGDSSGGHIALLTGLTAKHGELSTVNNLDNISGIICYCSPTDMFLTEREGPIEDLLGTDFVENVPELAKSASCGTYISDEREIPPILLFHGTDDECVSIENSRQLYDTLKR